LLVNGLLQKGKTVILIEIDLVLVGGDVYSLFDKRMIKRYVRALSAVVFKNIEQKTDRFVASQLYRVSINQTKLASFWPSVHLWPQLLVGSLVGFSSLSSFNLKSQCSL